MIKVIYSGTLGNNMWQYATGRVIAEKNGLKFSCDSIPGFKNTTQQVNGLEFNSPIKNLGGHIIDLKNEINQKIILNGYFQRYEYIKEYKKEIHNWFELDVQPPMILKKNDLILTIRRGWNGYPVELCPSKSFFENLLSTIEHERIILCTDTFNDSFFDFLQKYPNVIRANFSALEQFSLIKSANKIIITPSTFCWWASFLSNAEEIYFPMCDGLIPTKNGSNLVVDDETRYKYLNL